MFSGSTWDGLRPIGLIKPPRADLSQGPNPSLLDKRFQGLLERQARISTRLARFQVLRRTVLAHCQVLRDRLAAREQWLEQLSLGRHGFNNDWEGSPPELLIHEPSSDRACSLNNGAIGFRDYCSATDQGFSWGDWTVDRRQLYSMTGSIKSSSLHMLGHSGGLGSLRYLFRFHFRFKKRKSGQNHRSSWPEAQQKTACFIWTCHKCGTTPLPQHTFV